MGGKQKMKKKFTLGKFRIILPQFTNNIDSIGVQTRPAY